MHREAYVAHMLWWSAKGCKAKSGREAAIKGTCGRRLFVDMHMQWEEARTAASLL
jgi:hypothetical protein